MVIARCNGTLLVETDRGVGVVEQRGGWIGTALFVSVLVAAISTCGAVLAVLTVGAPGLALGVLPLLAGLAAVAVIRRKRAHAAGPLPAPWLEIDLRQGRVITSERPDGIPLTDVRLERVFQAGSSSKALALFCPAKIVIARGTPFGDEIDQLEAALRARGVGGRPDVG